MDIANYWIEDEIDDAKHGVVKMFAEFLKVPTLSIFVLEITVAYPS